MRLRECMIIEMHFRYFHSRLANKKRGCGIDKITTHRTDKIKEIIIIITVVVLVIHLIQIRICLHRRE